MYFKNHVLVLPMMMTLPCHIFVNVYKCIIIDTL